MNDATSILIVTAVAVGSGHALLGPDHYLPFVFMARAGRWSKAKTMAVTVACGLGHVLSSILISVAAIVFGWGVVRVQGWESSRGELAVWLLIGFGLAYCLSGLKVALRGTSHDHPHCHPDGISHTHPHAHTGEHLHAHLGSPEGGGIQRLTPWVMFTVLVLGPCEPLVPLLMMAAAQGGTGRATVVATAFGMATIVTMAGMTALLLCGLQRTRLGGAKRYSHALAGAALAATGFAVRLLGS